MTRWDPVRIGFRLDVCNPGHAQVAVFVGRNEGARGYSGRITLRTDEWRELVVDQNRHLVDIIDSPAASVDERSATLLTLHPTTGLPFATDDRWGTRLCEDCRSLRWNNIEDRYECRQSLGPRVGPTWKACEWIDRGEP